MKKVVAHVHRAQALAKEYIAKRPHRSFKRSKPRPPEKPLPSVWHLLRDTWQTLRQEKKAFIIFGALYAVLTYFVIGGLDQTDFVELKDATLQVLRGEFGAVGHAAALFTISLSGLVGIAAASEMQQLLSGLIAFIFWLAIIWFLRMRSARQAVGVRDAFYNSGAPFVPSFLVLVVAMLQALPAVMGVYVLSTAQAEQWVQSGVELMLFTMGTGLLCLLSGYWLIGTLLSLVIVTLPQTYPWRALSAGSELVIGQRWPLALRVVVLLVGLVVLWALLLIPALLLDNWLKFDWLPLIPIVAQAMAAFTLLASAVYVYKLYRSLL